MTNMIDLCAEQGLRCLQTTQNVKVHFSTTVKETKQILFIFKVV